jgi:GrpB-like predicted nucleotidyltransferase (UPF0157 family)
MAFRDYLRSHPKDASAYAALKRNLVHKFATDREAYNQGKTEFVSQILRRAGQDFTP